MMTYPMKPPGRRLEFLELEARWLLAQVIQIPPASESDGPLIQPPVITSVNGVLKANVALKWTTYNTGSPTAPPPFRSLGA